MQHLGVILAPFGKNGPGWYAESGPAYGGTGTYLGPARPYPTTDRFFNTRGEVGLYYDTQLGAIPTDAEMAKSYVCYTPVTSGWINAKEGFVPSPWRFGWDPAGAYGPQTSLSGLGMVMTGPKLVMFGLMAAIVGGTLLYKKQALRTLKKLRRRR
jgi:hypothetical protein